jgi:hypothetical protein
VPRYFYEILLGTSLFILAAIGARIISWSRQETRGSLKREQDALEPFREAFEAGEIDREEFERLTQALERQRERETANNDLRLRTLKLIPQDELIPEPPQPDETPQAEAY